MAEGIEVVVAHAERVTLRVGDTFVKVDSDEAQLDREVATMGLVPVTTPEVLWQQRSVLAISRVPGRPLGVLSDPSAPPSSTAAWVAAGAAVRTLHDAPLPPWPGHSVESRAERLASACEWLVANDAVPAKVVNRNRELAETVLRPWPLSFIHGDLQVDHVFVEGDEVSAIIDWSEAAPGDALFDLATLTVGFPERLDDVAMGYGKDVDRDLIRGWWAWRCLIVVPWLVGAGYGDPETFPEVAVLRRLAN